MVVVVVVVSDVDDLSEFVGAALEVLSELAHDRLLRVLVQSQPLHAALPSVSFHAHQSDSTHI